MPSAWAGGSAPTSVCVGAISVLVASRGGVITIWVAVTVGVSDGVTVGVTVGTSVVSRAASGILVGEGDGVSPRGSAVATT